MGDDTTLRRFLPTVMRLGLVLLWIAAALPASSMAQAEEFLARNEDERAMTGGEMRAGLAVVLEAAARA